MLLQKLFLVSSFLELIFCSIDCRDKCKNEIDIRNLYSVKVATLGADNIYGPAVPITENTRGLCLKYFPSEDLLVICYDTENGSRPNYRITIESTDNSVPTLLSLRAPKELQTYTSIVETTTPDVTQPEVVYTVQIVIPSSFRSNKIFVRFLSTVDITSVDGTANQYYLSSEYFINNTNILTATGYTLNNVSFPSNACIWYRKAVKFISCLFNRPCIGNGDLKNIAYAYKSEQTRKCVYDSLKHCERPLPEKCHKPCDSDSESDSVCEIKPQKVCEPNDCPVTPKAIYKSIAISAVFNCFEDFEFREYACKKIIPEVLKLEVDVSVEIAICILENILYGYKSEEDYAVQDCILYRESLCIPEISYDSILSSCNGAVSSSDSLIIKKFCKEDEAKVDSCLLTKTPAPAPAKVVKHLSTSKKVVPCKVKAKLEKKKKSAEEDDSSSEAEEKGTSGVTKAVIVVGIVTVIIGFAVGVSYLI